jgi:hypothetical protein
VAAAWSKIPGSDNAKGYSVKSVQVATEEAPTAATDGADLHPCAGYKLYAEADSGQTFTGSGDFPAYSYDPICGWSRASEWDCSAVAADNGNRRILLGEFPVSAPRGRVAHVCSGVGVSGGGVTLYYAMSGLYGERI